MLASITLSAVCLKVQPHLLHELALQVSQQLPGQLLHLLLKQQFLLQRLQMLMTWQLLHQLLQLAQQLLQLLLVLVALCIPHSHRPLLPLLHKQLLQPHFSSCLLCHLIWQGPASAAAVRTDEFQ